MREIARKQRPILRKVYVRRRRFCVEQNLRKRVDAVCHICADEMYRDNISCYCDFRKNRFILKSLSLFVCVTIFSNFNFLKPDSTSKVRKRGKLKIQRPKYDVFHL